MVQKGSAVQKCSRDPDEVLSIDRDHSAMVKFSPGDVGYNNILDVLRKIVYEPMLYPSYFTDAWERSTGMLLQTTRTCHDCGREFSITVAVDGYLDYRRYQGHSCSSKRPEVTYPCRGRGCHNIYRRDENRREHERRCHSTEGLPPPS